MRRWLLPEAIEDVLPAEAWQIETLRRRLLDEFRRHGYEYVIPPLLEYVESLLIGSGRDLDLRTFKLVDQLSGRTLGVRADIAPQVARIDAHLLNRTGVTRLCYCGSVLHTLPANLTATRQPLQIGAELYGHAGSQADAEMLHLLARVLQLSGVTATRIDLGHVGIFRTLAAGAGFAGERLDELFSVLQAKDLPGLRELLEETARAETTQSTQSGNANTNNPAAASSSTSSSNSPISAAAFRAGLLALPELYGDVSVLDKAAAILPDLPAIKAALDELRALAAELDELPVSFDLGDLRGLHYHSGIVYAAYCTGHPGAIALGGRYDKVGRAFGRDRAATGFSLDLRELAQLASNGTQRRAIVAPQLTEAAAVAEAGQGRAALRQVVADLRAADEVVIDALPGDTLHDWREAGCDRQLVWRDDRWQAIDLK